MQRLPTSFISKKFNSNQRKYSTFLFCFPRLKVLRGTLALPEHILQECAHTDGSRQETAQLEMRPAAVQQPDTNINLFAPGTVVGTSWGQAAF